MTIEESVAELKRLNDSLTGLLEDPHVGLATWITSVGQTVEKMAKIVGYKGGE